jgi:hypothetical protein
LASFVETVLYGILLLFDGEQRRKGKGRGLEILLAATINLAPAGETDRTAALMSAVDQVRAAGSGEIRLETGLYHFCTPTAMNFYASNHDNPPCRATCFFQLPM